MSITSERIKKSRKEKGLTMNELAKIMGVAQALSFVGKMEQQSPK